MSRLVKKALHSFSREKLPPTEKSFVSPPALEVPIPPLTGTPVTLAIIGGGQRGNASALLVPVEQCRAVTDSPRIGARQLRSHSRSLLQGSRSGRASSPNPSGVCQYVWCSLRECLRITYRTARCVRCSRQGREAKDFNGSHHLRPRPDACRIHDRVYATGLSCALRKTPGSGRTRVYRGC